MPGTEILKPHFKQSQSLATPSLMDEGARVW